jgi:hypothetical protein
MATVPRDPLPDWFDGALWRAALDRWLPALPQSAAAPNPKPTNQTEEST